jgi:hypothetical protein
VESLLLEVSEKEVVYLAYAYRTHSTEAVISPNKPYLIVRLHVVRIESMCLHGFDFLFRKEPVVFACFEALTDRFFVHFRHELPGPNVKTETRTPLNALY